MSRQQNLNDVSSSSDENDDVLEALKEATDKQFFKESFFNNVNENGNHPNYKYITFVYLFLFS